MANKSKVQSVEPDIADLVNGWLKSYGLDYKLEQASLNSEIDKALDEYHSKIGGKGGNRPDAKLLLKDKYGTFYPVLIEYKGYKDKLVKLDTDGIVDNKKDKNEPNYTNIKSYAVNGAIHYANAILHYTSYTRIIAIGVTGYKDEFGKLQHEIGVYYVSADKNNLGFGQRVGDYTDLSFLKTSHFDEFVEKLNELSLTQAEIDKLKEKREKEINISLVKLNNDIYKEETGLGENDRIYLVAATIIATLGAEGVKPLEKSDLGSSTESGETDGDKIIRKITSFLKKKQLPQQKQDLIIRTLSNTLVDENRNKPENGESQIKRVFSKIVDDLGIYYKIGITTDFTGMLFNEMYNWLGFTQDKLNDVVLTPSYVARLLVKLARVDKDSYVWDFATGSAGLLVAAMNEMIDDAKEKISSPEEYQEKVAKIKATQLLGLEILPQIYMLAILNMILMGDGSSNILNQDSLKNFDGNYGFSSTKKNFPATAFVLNPPYSADGNGMIFVEKALSMMENGYAAIIIQNSAGSGKAVKYNKEILKHSTLLPKVYKFNKKNAQFFLASMNIAFSKFSWGSSRFNVDVLKEQVIMLPTKCDSIDFEFMESFIEELEAERIKELEAERIEELEAYLSVSGLKDTQLTADELSAVNDLISKNIEFKPFCYDVIFDKIVQGRRLKKDDQIAGDIPFVMAGVTNTGVVGYISNPVASFPKNSITIDIFGNAFYRNYDFGAGDDTGVYWSEKSDYSKEIMLFLTCSMGKSIENKFSYGKKLRSSQSFKFKMQLPVKNEQPDYELMSTLISAIQKLVIADVVKFSDEKIKATKQVVG